MPEKDQFSLVTPHFTLEGRSRAGHETWFRIRDLGIAFDIGRCPDAVVSMPNVFITHAHLDHAAGIPFYAGQRHLQKLDGGTIHVPVEAANDVRELMNVQSRLTGSMTTGSMMNVSIVGVAAGEEVRCGRRHLVRGYAASHRVAARAYELIERRRHLREEFAGATSDEIARLRNEGIAIDEEHLRSVFFYTGDTDRGLLESCDALYRAEVLLIECSFITDGHQDRAVQYQHLHIDDIADFADRFENELIVLTHFSRRYTYEEIRDGVRQRLPRSLHARVRLALPEPWQRL
ncbi:MAG TPA: MBL fold metallo-hydrolase [Thermoanaerobaculia bacterium]|jgi:ribonuclease Z|nr:MBL fold metallo-hydrolase [Thermoanaerobaculia bacterium]